MNFYSLTTFSAKALLLLVTLASCHNLRVDVSREREVHAREDWECFCPEKQSSVGPLDFPEFLSLVKEKNLELAAKAQECALYHEMTTAAKLRTLPSLIFSGTFSGRNRHTGGFSQSLDPFTPPAPPSVGLDRGVKRYDISATWNLLDFGIGYLRAKQSQEQHRLSLVDYSRVEQLLTQECVEVYWQAQSYAHGRQKVEALKEQIGQFIATLEDEALWPHLSEDRRQRIFSALIEARQRLSQYERDYKEALFRMAELIAQPFADIVLADESFEGGEVCNPDTCELTQAALVHRPELYSLDAEQRISLTELRVAFYQLFPDVTLFADMRYDSNFFLIFNRWLVAGLSYTYDLLQGPQHIQEMITGAERVKLIKWRRLGISVAITAQIQIAQLHYHYACEEYQQSLDLAESQRRLLTIMEERVETGELGQLDLLLSYGLEAFYSEMALAKAYADLRVAEGQIEASIGIPGYFDSLYSEGETVCDVH